MEATEIETVKFAYIGLLWLSLWILYAPNWGMYILAVPLGVWAGAGYPDILTLIEIRPSFTQILSIETWPLIVIIAKLFACITASFIILLATLIFLIKLWKLLSKAVLKSTG
ncbi:hypothetical protein KC902_01540 [Candidatus Kaiserbacteria bacterium]|nr:hypothetical protein [Candidatus Kaiserbacteria bacterium]